MASTQQLKRRIGSVKNTKQITKAMELVAASKMRKATESAHRGRDYRKAALDMLSKLSSVTTINEHPLYAKRKVQAILYLVITSNRGLAGAYNSNVIKTLTKELSVNRQAKVASKVIIVGNRGAQFLRRVEGIDILAVYDDLGDKPIASDVRPILNTILEEYSTESVDEVRVIYTEHRSSIVQTVESIKVLPAEYESDDDSPRADVSNFTFEPSVEDVLENVTERLIEVQIWQSLLESIASEQSMRMMSMKNATDNASEIIDDLTLEFNTARQAKITQELAEITGGVEAMK
ncbi:ATP synthase F1 subunit gamma [Candidatus Saccharibacteria bacterium]|nr:ATP synthase F1 subunit gamma [Candidatus Saccharibacteria bacterium]